MARKPTTQLEIPMPRGWGGAREGAGRPRVLPRPGPAHIRRSPHDARHPAHVTLRARTGLPSLRSARVFSAVRRAIAASNSSAFRIVHFSVQTDHLHLIVEGDSSRVMTKGLRGLAIRCALAINRAARRRGPVWSHRHHIHALKTPTEVRRAIAYVLLNFRKHLGAAPGIDPRSSGSSFDGWSALPNQAASYGSVARSRTWLAAVGWRRGGGAIGFDDLNRR
jgi:putative transposase